MLRRAPFIDITSHWEADLTSIASNLTSQLFSSSLDHMTQVTDAWVTFDLGIAQEQTANISDAFAEVGIRAEVREQPYSLVASGGAELRDAFVVIATTTATAFLSAIATKAGSDVYAGL